MVLEASRQSSVYCTFTESEITKHFGMSMERFINNKSAVIKFSELLLKKAGKREGMSETSIDNYNICFYKISGDDYAISLTRSADSCYSVLTQKKDKNPLRDALMSDCLNSLQKYFCSEQDKNMGFV